MKQFFKFMFASMLGFILVNFLIFLFLLGIIGAIASFGSKEPKAVAENSVLHLELSAQIIDRATDNPFDGFEFGAFSSPSTTGLNELLMNIKKAKEDTNIEGIFLDMSFTQGGWATMNEIRAQLIDFKQGGKFIIAYGDYMAQGAYYLATVADEIYLNPEGMIDFRGLNASTMFLKNMLEKIGVEIEIIRHGKYKSAGEMFFNEQMSPENRAQTLAYVSSLWNTVLKDISEQRNISANKLNEAADAFASRNAEGALEAGLIDGIAFRDEVMDNLKEKLQLDENKRVNLVDYARYNLTPLPDSMLPVGKRDKIAVIYGSGNIVMGKGNEQSMGSEQIAEALQKARMDTTVKAIVFRINSGGGVSLAGDIMLREAMLAGESKPMVVSMGDMAASAGYLIASYADKIIASPNTITGSIGVFGMIPNMKEMFNDKLGITFDQVKTNELADFGSLNRPLNRAEREIFQQLVDRTYESFVNHVAEGRGLPVATVDSIAQGRVWSGVDAKRIGLIDDFGGLNYAIEQAAQLAEIDNYRIVEYPEKKDFFVELMESFGEVETRFLKARLGDFYPVYEKAQQATKNTGILMRMPYDVSIE